MKTIVLVYAMAKERDASLKLLSSRYNVETLSAKRHRVITKQQTLYLLHAGVTMLNAYKLAEFLMEGKVDEVIQVGTCAGLRHLQIGDVIHSQTFYHHEIDISFFPQSLPHLQIKDKTTYHQHPVLVSGNTFLANPNEVRRVIEKFDADAFDMESFGFYAICKEKGIPFSSIRGVTDDGQDHAEQSFENNLELASHAAGKKMMDYLGL
jgi:adenosylhomocysteine nucleosidase